MGLCSPEAGDDRQIIDYHTNMMYTTKNSDSGFEHEGEKPNQGLTSQLKPGARDPNF